MERIREHQGKQDSQLWTWWELRKSQTRIHYEYSVNFWTILLCCSCPELYKLPWILFPSTACFSSKSPGEFMEIHLLYPETENRTKTFVPTMPNSRIRSWKRSNNHFSKAVATVVEQDSTESLYPRQKPRIRLPNEEIMFYAEKLYWIGMPKSIAKLQCHY